MRRILRLKWAVAMIAREFGKDTRTIGKMLAAAELDASVPLTTLQVFSAMVGDLGAERIRLTREQADKVAMENAVLRRQLLPMADVRKILDIGFDGISKCIGASDLSEHDREKTINALRDCAGRLGAIMDADAEESSTADG